MEFNSKNLIQFIPKYEEVAVPSIKEFNHNAFDIFDLERKQELNLLKHIEFSGRLVKGLKDGKGGFKCPQTQSFFYGSWV